ncbi:splicing factor U2af large subunit B-like protein isoform X3, partial [Tanacetum coccineum]
KMALQIDGFNLPGAGVVSADDLLDDGEYEDILEDMREEGGKFGDLTNVVIPRPNSNGDQVHGLGKLLKKGDASASSISANMQQLNI